MKLLNMNYHHLYKLNDWHILKDTGSPYFNSKGKRTKPQKRKFKRGKKR